MVRRLQLLDEPSERRFAARRWSALGSRIRDGLLRDNKVIPAVLAVLALLIFAWLVAGLFIGDNGQEEQQASKGAALSQAPGEGTNGGGAGAPTPGVDSRDTESFAAFKPKDPFRQIVSKAGESTNGSTTASSGNSGGSNGSSRGGSGGDSSKGGISNNGSRSSSGGGGNGGAGGGTTAPAANNPGGGGGGNAGGGKAGGSANAGGGNNAGGGGSGGLFNSGGDLPAP